MRSGLCHIALVVGCLVASAPFLDAQQSPLASPTPGNQTCPVSANDEDKPAGPEISIAQVTFSGDLQLPLSEQEAIAESIRQTTHGTVLNVVTDEALERARAGWQDQGYFKVEVRGDTKILTASSVGQSVALDVHVDEGSRYRLSGITFKNNKAITVSERLRQFFPVNDGDIFSREKIAAGLENLRKAYGEIGYINFTSVPDTAFDEENNSISLAIDIDEGKQFRIRAIRVLGLEDSARQQFLKSLPIKSGQIYNSWVWEQALPTKEALLPCDCPNRQQRLLDEKFGIVMLTFDFRPCNTN
jgi:outer membrane protein assembly factor BamA